MSAAVIALQVALMRSLALRYYHHFSYFVISTALLGFGVSGTVLHLTSHYLQRHFREISLLLVLLFSLSISVLYALSLRLALDIQYIFFSQKQFLLLFVTKFLFFCPFFFGATFIGLNLLYFRKKIGQIYGLNLVGSGVGGLGITLLLGLLPPLVLPFWIPLLIIPVFLFWIFQPKNQRAKKREIWLWVLVLLSMITSFYFLIFPPSGNYDSYKMIAHLERLEKQKDATRLVKKFSPRGQIEVFDCASQHHTLFAGLGATMMPPPQLTILVDGHRAGAVFKVKSKVEAGILDHTPQSIGYELTRPDKVLLLGEIGGVNLWLATRYNAREITVVQGNPQLNALLKDELSDQSGNIYKQSNIKVIDQEPHLFIQQTQETFDIVHIVSGEGMSAGSSGLLALHENYLFTEESIALCYGILSDRGLLTLTRGIQYPPRDNIRIFALFAQAMESLGIKSVEEHLIQVRNYLAATTLLSKRKFTEESLNGLKEICGEKKIDIEYHPSFGHYQTNRFNLVQGPAGKHYSYFYHAIQKILSEEREQFFDEWIYNVAPNTNNAPYFYNFFKWKSLSKFFEIYKTNVFQKLEIGYLVLVASLVETTITGFLLILLPLFFFRSKKNSRPIKSSVVLYFFSLGMAFMFIEMVLIRKFIRFLGDPIYSVTLVITVMLISAGLGSHFQSRISQSSKQKIRFGVLGIVILLLGPMFLFDSIMTPFIHFTIASKLFMSSVLLFPLSFLMGWIFPIGITKLSQNAPELIPWAWGVNGFASVVAIPLAMILSMSFGFTFVLIIASILYIIVGGIVSRSSIFS